LEVTTSIVQTHIDKALLGQQAAYNFLLNTFWNDVYGFQLKRTQNTYEAEEITIETFSKAFDKLSTYKKEYTFSTWLTTISKNIHIDRIRKKQSSIRSHISFKNNDELVSSLKDDAPTAEDTIIREQNLAQLLQYIKGLKPGYQEMINLRYFQEMSYKEMAEYLDEPMNNVKVKLLRARRLLTDVITRAEQ